MDKRVYGIIGIKSKMANWNADFTGYPKTTSSGETFASDKALKYTMKKMWQNQGEKILYVKSMKLSKKNDMVYFVPRSLKEKYENLFEIEDLKKCKDSKSILINLFSALDVKNFGATFAEVGNNISITGAVQISQGINKYSISNAEEQNILSPFRDSTKDNIKPGIEEARNSTLGSKIISDEAHYYYFFVINPLAYNDYIELDVTNGYSESDYNKFKEAAICSVTSFSTNSKIGCENEFSLFIETDINLYLPNLSEYILFYKENGINVIEVTCSDLINSVIDRINEVQIYYNVYNTIIKTNIKCIKFFNIFTKQEVEQSII